MRRRPESSSAASKPSSSIHEEEDLSKVDEEVHSNYGVKRPKRSAYVWWALLVLIIQSSWAVHYYQFESMPMPLSADQVGKRGFSEQEAMKHVVALTELGPHPVGSDALDSALQGSRPQSINDKPVSAAGNSSSKTWGISSIFSSRASSGENSTSRSLGETVHDMEQMPSTILLGEPASILRPSEMTEHEAVEIIVTKLLLRSYYDIVRKNMQDLVPKAIMHFLVNHTKRDLLSTFIQKLYRENLVEEMLQEQDEVVTKRKRTREMFYVLQQAVQTLDEVESDVSFRSSNSSLGTDTTSGLPESPGLPFHLYSSTNGET